MVSPYWFNSHVSVLQWAAKKVAVIVMVCLLRSHCQAHLTPAAPLSYTECNYKSDKQLSIHFTQVSKSKKVARSPGERPNFWQPSPRRSTTSLLFFFLSRLLCKSDLSHLFWARSQIYVSRECQTLFPHWASMPGGSFPSALWIHLTCLFGKWSQSHDGDWTSLLPVTFKATKQSCCCEFRHVATAHRASLQW